jgi:hypothetical protein
VPIAAGLHPWDAAHRAREGHAGLEAFAPGAAAGFVEPDVVQPWPWRRASPPRPEASCEEKAPDGDWPAGPFGWHLAESHSQLAAARRQVGEAAQRAVRVAILDTGFDPRHDTRPLGLDPAAAANFVEGDGPGDAAEPDDSGRGLGEQRGHGTATLALLAGARVERPGFADFLGGAPHVTIVPVRIAESVLQLATSALARGIDHAVAAGCHVISISMGGVPSRAWAQAVNRAYEAGVAIFAAAGNNLAGFPTTTLVYPARFHRVVAVCGVTHAQAPYHRGLGHPGLQGNAGPPSRMGTALAAYTPNVPWAEIGCGSAVSLDGAGTSAATPQAAAAAALWLARHPDALAARDARRVEAVRAALFETAVLARPAFRARLGHGALRALDALDRPVDLARPPQPEDRVGFAWLRVGAGREALATPRQQMLELEALQLYLSSSRLQRLARRADPAEDELAPADRQRLLDALARDRRASRTLRGALREAAAQR